jgi:hypothetical protein
MLRDARVLAGCLPTVPSVAYRGARGSTVSAMAEALDGVPVIAVWSDYIMTVLLRRR